MFSLIQDNSNNENDKNNTQERTQAFFFSTIVYLTREQQLN